MLRIFPLYYGFMLFILALTPFLHLQWNGWQTYFLTYTAILVYWSRPAWNLGFFNINHFWTLQVEELFYLMWPLIVFRIRNKRRLVIVALLLCVAALSLRLAKTSLPYTQFPFLYLLNSPIISRADDLLFGCILALLFRTSYRAKILANAARVFTVCFTLLIALGLSRHGFETTDKIVGTVGITLLDIAACSLVAMTFVAKSKTKRLFENSVLRQFGHYSYGLYVYHFSLAGLMLPRMRPFLNAHLHSKALSVVAAGLVVGLVSYGVALISYNLYEVRFLHFKKYFSYQSPKALQPLPLDQQPAS
jgi:peptidoglycan/LPS O-acetylase OafA/YrhL